MTRTKRVILALLLALTTAGGLAGSQIFAGHGTVGVTTHLHYAGDGDPNPPKF